MKRIFSLLETTLDRYSHLSSVFLRVGLAIVFLYAAISSFLSPNDWIGYLPSLLTELFPAKALLTVFSIIELLLTAWLLSGVYTRYAGLFSAAMLGGIIISNFSLLPISFRDIGLLFAALALAIMKHK